MSGEVNIQLNSGDGLRVYPQDISVDLYDIFITSEESQFTRDQFYKRTNGLKAQKTQTIYKKEAIQRNEKKSIRLSTG